MTFKFEYLGGFEFIFESNLQKESGDQEPAFDGKKTEAKNSCKETIIYVMDQHTHAATPANSSFPLGDLLCLFLIHESTRLCAGP
jgi:hypothetical protein